MQADARECAEASRFVEQEEDTLTEQVEYSVIARCREFIATGNRMPAGANPFCGCYTRAMLG